MTKEEFLSHLPTLQRQLGHWQLEIGQESFSEFSFGCFYEQETGLWKVFINYDRGMHVIDSQSAQETKAFDALYALAEYLIEMNTGN